MKCGAATGEPIVYARKYEELVTRVNENWPGCAVLATEKRELSQNWSDDDIRDVIKEVMRTAPFEERSEAQLSDWAPEGMDSADIDWESFDYEPD